VLLSLSWLAGAATAGADAIEGVWQVENKQAHIRIARCGVELCGTIVWLRDSLDEHGRPHTDSENGDPDLRSRPVLGLDILHIGAEPDGEGVWRGGRIYDPDSGRTYRCTLKLDGENVLRMRGYMGIPLLGHSTRWTRIESEVAEPTPPR